jgi:hypothetical protein
MLSSQSSALRAVMLAALLGGACSKHDGRNLGGFLADGSGGACTSCLSDTDCGAQICAQLADDSYCASTCTSSSSCGAGRSCIPVSDTAGNQVSVCVDDANLCGGGPLSPDMATGTSGSQTCGSLEGPTVSASCKSCSGTSKGCQANGCYGGWWCNKDTSKCQAPPSSCGTSSGTDGGTVTSAGFGTTPTGSVTSSGGSVSRLLFAVVGDTRPPNPDDVSGYPTAVAMKIFTDVQNMSAKPSFMVTTGDYQYSTPTGTTGTTQLTTYLGLRAIYTGVVFPAMGNHECTGYTDSNCVTGSSDLTGNNTYPAYLSKLLAPINQTKPYYSINVNASDSSWTAKFVFIAANAWDSTQSSWLDTTLAQATTYTFIVRHEPAEANTAPGVTPSETIMKKYPYTLAIVGHTHTYSHSGQEVLIGNGGAPLTGSKDYGYGVFSQQSDKTITVDMVDYSSNQLDSSFHFAVNPDGTAAP